MENEVVAIRDLIQLEEAVSLLKRAVSEIKGEKNRKRFAILEEEVSNIERAVSEFHSVEVISEKRKRDIERSLND